VYFVQCLFRATSSIDISWHGKKQRFYLQVNPDPCLFIHYEDNIMVFSYVDDRVNLGRKDLSKTDAKIKGPSG
jgi:hypothetical protein